MLIKTDSPVKYRLRRAVCFCFLSNEYNFLLGELIKLLVELYHRLDAFPENIQAEIFVR